MQDKSPYKKDKNKRVDEMLLDPRISPKTALYALKNAVKPHQCDLVGNSLGLPTM